ncbi:MLO-like protein 6 isoform X2 [Juglans microcarpa x Juglans regia]|uniref:MLO-like protein 6 isoform X2 n=1 Tax=Juglans microcarpa x Juglans regia TaxID=2249226 RepID=UPI001B7E3098|nr:MLO-like protein 6 isoform X2 [Juglans microcarpa x Juglans regia]
MAGASGGRTLEETPTWAVAVVCFVLVFISIIIEHIIHLIAKWLKKKHKRALFEALEKIKSELMLLGFISLLLTVGQGPISNVCISEKMGAKWHPCEKKQETQLTEDEDEDSESNGRKLLMVMSDSGGSFRRILASATSTDNCAAKGKVPFVSEDGIHQLHIFIFVLAVFHVLYCILTLALGTAKMRRWKHWETETRTAEYQFSHDPERFRFARDTSFGRRHLSFWTKTPALMWIAHLAPQSHKKFDFQKYINRSLEEDFKVVVGISPLIWFSAVIFLLFNTHGWKSYLWLPFIPLIIILLVGTKLQVIITKMALRIQERGEVVKGEPVVIPGDELFWFNRPRLLLFLINFVLFQNAFQLAFFAWAWYEFGLKSCFHEDVEDIVIQIAMGVLVQILCSYVTLPLYALVTQMGSSMKPTIFNDRVAAALRNWHHTARKHLKQQKGSASVTPFSSRPTTPSHYTSPVYLLRHHRSDMTDSVQGIISPRRSSNFDIDHLSYYCETDSPSHRGFRIGDGSTHGHHLDQSSVAYDKDVNEITTISQTTARMQHEIEIGPQPKDFSFDKRTSL